MNAVVITPQEAEDGATKGAWEVCLALRDAVSLVACFLCELS